MSNELNVSLWASGVLGPGESAQWFQDIAPNHYNTSLKRVRIFSAVPFVYVANSGQTLSLPPDPPFPAFEQRIAVTQVFHLLKATPPVPPGVYPPNAPQLQINVVITNLMDDFPVTYQIYIAETDN
jgi:hypothetical protein